MTEYYEDVEVGAAREFGGYEMTREEIVEFAEQYDPQPFHVDETAATGAIGIDDLRWKQPVRPGDVLHVETEVLDKEPWQGNLGLVRSQTRVYNQDDTEVMSMVGLLLFEMREA